MPRTVMVLNQPTLKVSTTQAGLATGQAVECQVTSAVITASPNFSTIPPTGCAPSAQSPGATSFALDLAWLQDWSVGTPGGLSWFALQNDGKAVWFELTPDKTVSTQKVTGNAYCVTGSYGGEFGTGNPATATATWPMLTGPAVPTPSMMMVEGQQAEPQQAEPQPAGV
jgi:hypothetical protein